MHHAIAVAEMVVGPELRQLRHRLLLAVAARGDVQRWNREPDGIDNQLRLFAFGRIR